MKIKKTFFLLSLVGTLVGGCSKEEISGLSSIGFPKSNEIYYSTSDGNYLDLESYDWYKNSIKSHKRVNDSIFILNFIQDINKIEKMFFYGCSSLTGITIPNSVKEIESEAFNGCRSLKNFTIPEGVTTINRSTFAGCSSLTNITIPNSVKEIGGGAFEGCSSLTSITIPNSVKEIGNGAFSDCSSLKNITIPEGVATINWGTFNGCSSLTNVTIPNSVKTIDINAFADCKSLTNLTLPEGLTSLGAYVFLRTSINNLTIPQSVNKLSDGAFGGFLGTNIIIHENLNIKRIPSECFSSCLNLTNITIPKSVEEIGFRAFSGCTSLEEITIPENVTEIEWEAFTHCFKLKRVFCKSLVPPSIAPIEDKYNLWEDYTPKPLFHREKGGKSLDIYVPLESVSAYKIAWNDYADKIIGYNFE